jgi:hypothetical protein
LRTVASSPAPPATRAAAAPGRPAGSRLPSPSHPPPWVRKGDIHRHRY